MKNSKEFIGISFQNKADGFIKEKKLNNIGYQLSKPKIQRSLKQTEVTQIELNNINSQLILAKEEVKIATQKLLELFQNAPINCFTLSKNGEILNSNLFAANLLKKDCSQVIGTNFLEYLTVNSRAQFKTFLKNSFNTKNKESFEITIISDENLIYCKLKGFVNEIGDEFFMILEDYTEKKERDNAFIKSETRLKDIVSSMYDWVWEVDEKGIYTYCSNQSINILGYTRENIIGKTPFDFMPEEEAKRVAKIFSEIVARKAPIKDLENWNIGKNNEEICFLTNGVPTLDEMGNLKGYRGVDKDITIRKKAEKELIIAKEKAVENDRLKSAFLANISHEIRTPMNGILGFAELLREPKLSSEEHKEYLEIIEKSGARMLNTINDIIAISKVESNEVNLKISQTNLIEEIKFICAFFQSEAELKGIQIFLNNTLPTNNAIIDSDKDKIGAILSKLIINAITYSKSGFIEIGIQKKNDFFEIYVKDNGIGIGPEHKEIIFERFRQASENLSRNYEGAGLGLSISKAYIEMLGGEIWLKSELGKGSTFFFTLSSTKFQKEYNEIKNGTLNIMEENLIQSLKILIVEDDDVSSIILHNIVGIFAKEILSVRTGIEAVEFCRSNPEIDLVLIDVKMPELDGYEATELIREFNKDVIIIAQTAFAMPKEKNKAMEAGCNDYISKPIYPNLLNDIIKRHFENKRNINPNQI
ncbi:MAG: response regulator [Bacteroidetes bacterium]|nr:response regulator [Bacteroidota bacterium]